jgi:hypothetical protein
MPSLTPTYGLGSGARTGLAVAISSPRTKIGSQGRVYAFYSQRGQGELYKQQLATQLGVQFMPRVNNPLSVIQF